MQSAFKAPREGDEDRQEVTESLAAAKPASVLVELTGFGVLNANSNFPQLAYSEIIWDITSWLENILLSQ